MIWGCLQFTPGNVIRSKLTIFQRSHPICCLFLMENLTRTHPEVDIYVREALTSKLIQELAEGRLDTAIVALPISEPSFTEVALFAENFLLVRPREDTGKPVPSSKML